MTNGELDARHVAARVAARAEPRDVRLLNIHVPALRRQPQPPLVYELKSDVRVEYEPGDESFVVACSYEVIINEPPETDSSESRSSEPGAGTDDSNSVEPLAELRFDYAALFNLQMREGDEPASEEELQAFAATTGQFALYPFARQFIYDMTGRLGLPALTVGAFQLEYDPEEPQGAHEKATQAG